MAPETTAGLAPGLRRTLMLVVALNLAFVSVEFAVALKIESVSLFADATDFLEDASISMLVLLGLKWPPERRALLGKVLAGIILLPSLAALWMAWRKFNDNVEPEPFLLSLTGFWRACRQCHLPPSCSRVTAIMAAA